MSASFSFTTYAESLAAEVTAAKRTIIGAICSLAVLAVGTVCGIYIAGYLGAAALVFTGWTFLAVCVELFIIMLGWAASAVAAHVVNEWITSGNAGQVFTKAGGWIKGLFVRDNSTYLKEERVEQMNGDEEIVMPTTARAKRDNSRATDATVKRTTRKGAAA